MNIHPDEAYWENRYQQGQTGWDIGYASAPLTEFTRQFENKQAAVLIPGCGNAYEAIELVKQGYRDITLLDISPTVTAQLKQQLEGFPVKVICGDFFDHEGAYDLILEQTFFCASPPARRDDYVRKMHQLLRAGGDLAGVLFNRSFDGGPPFGGTKEEYQKRFEKYFRIIKMEICYNSIPPRAGSELFFIAENQAA